MQIRVCNDPSSLAGLLNQTVVASPVTAVFSKPLAIAAICNFCISSTSVPSECELIFHSVLLNPLAHQEPVKALARAGEVMGHVRAQQVGLKSRVVG